MGRTLIRLNVIMKSITDRWWADSYVLPCSPRQLQRRQKFIVIRTGMAERQHARLPITASHHRPRNIIRRYSTDRTSLDIRSSIMFRRLRVHIQRVTRQMAIHQVSKTRISFFTKSNIKFSHVSAERIFYVMNVLMKVFSAPLRKASEFTEGKAAMMTGKLLKSIKKINNIELSDIKQNIYFLTRSPWHKKASRCSPGWNLWLAEFFHFKNIFYWIWKEEIPPEYAFAHLTRLLRETPINLFILFHNWMCMFCSPFLSPLEQLLTSICLFAKFPMRLFQFTEKPENLFISFAPQKAQFTRKFVCSQVERHIRRSTISTYVLAFTTSLKGMLQSILAAIDSNPAWIASRRKTMR